MKTAHLGQHRVNSHPLNEEMGPAKVPLPWVRLDTAFGYNPKLLAMLAERDGHRAGMVYVCSLGYSGAHGTGGFIPAEALPFIHGRPVDAERLVRHGFWQPQPGGWLIHDWDKFQESTTETEQRRAKAQKAAHARWDKAKANGQAGGGP